MTTLCLIHDTISGQIEIGDYIITDELLTSCSHASNMYLKKLGKGSSSRRINCSKEKKTELQATAQKLVDSADMKANEAEKRTDVPTLKASLIKSNAP